MYYSAIINSEVEAGIKYKMNKLWCLGTQIPRADGSTGQYEEVLEALTKWGLCKITTWK